MHKPLNYLVVMGGLEPRSVLGIRLQVSDLLGTEVCGAGKYRDPWCQVRRRHK